MHLTSLFQENFKRCYTFTIEDGPTIEFYFANSFGAGLPEDARSPWAQLKGHIQSDLAYSRNFAEDFYPYAGSIIRRLRQNLDPEVFARVCLSADTCCDFCGSPATQHLHDLWVCDAHAELEQQFCDDCYHDRWTTAAIPLSHKRARLVDVYCAWCYSALCNIKKEEVLWKKNFFQTLQNLEGMNVHHLLQEMERKHPRWGDELLIYHRTPEKKKGEGDLLEIYL